MVRRPKCGIFPNGAANGRHGSGCKIRLRRHGRWLAAPIFASSAIAIPLLLDRRVGVLQAVVTSWETVLVNPAPMALWASLIMGLTLLGLLTALLGLIAVMPLLGHASWHAYRELVDASAWPERTAPREEGRG